MGDGAQKYTVDDAINAIGFGKYQILVLAYAGMALVSEAMEMMLLSFIGPAVQVEWDLSSNEESMITSIVFAGMLIGAYSFGVISDSFGRRKGFLVTAIITSAAGFFSAFAPNYATLVFFRFFVGVGLSGGHVLSSWFLEFIPAPSRGTWVSVSSMFWTLGTVLEALLAWIVMPLLGWRWLLVLSAIPSSFLLIFYSKTPESPRYLCTSGRINEARQVLEKIALTNRKKFPSGISLSDHKISKVTNIPSEDAQLLLPTKGDGATHHKIGSRTHNSASIMTLLSPKLLKSTLLLWAVFFGNAFTYYGLVLLTTELSNGNNKCDATQLEPRASTDVSYRNVFLTSFAEFPAKILSAVMVDKVGRKGSMSSMLFLCCLFLAPLGFNQSSGLVFLLFSARICITTASTVLHIYAPEIYPTAVRSTGFGVASSVGRIGGILCPLVAVSLVHDCHTSASILLFEIVIFVSGLCVVLFPLETKGLKLTDDVSDLDQEVQLT